MPSSNSEGMVIHELVVISGKGGTGKTSVAASLAVLAGESVLADCDVDAADLHLILSPVIEQRHDFYSGRQAVIRSADCVGCGDCKSYCRFDAVFLSEEGTHQPVYAVDPFACEGCGVCVRFCPNKAIDFPERLCGEWMTSSTRYGPMVHARLAAAAENSGKLVSLVRQEARRIAEETGQRRILVDGPPGIGCPVIASLTGASQVLAVTEPTLSGEHDLARLLALTRHFNIPAAVCVNKYDIDVGMTERIEQAAVQAGAAVIGRIRYDRTVTRAQMQAKAVVETDSPAADDLRQIWSRLIDQE
ncbi:MAG TPA: ATP-binding protein [bacterium]|nr:ATP-binding protein [bacterium]